MARRASGFQLSFLDLLCSALGGAILLALIFSIIRNPVQTPVIGEFILAEISSSVDYDLGMVVTPPGGNSLCIFPEMNEEELAEFSETATGGIHCWQGKSDDGGIRLFVELRNPVQGPWILRPYVFDWREARDKAVPIRIDGVWQRNGRLTGPDEEARNAITASHAVDTQAVVVVGQVH